MGTARFTVVAPECVRLEHSLSGEFVDAPSLFARERGGDVRVVEEGDGTVEIETGRMMVRYRPDGRGFTPENLQIVVNADETRGGDPGRPARAAASSRSAGEPEIEWRPGMRNERNLGGTLETLDRVRGRVDLLDGLLSRNGWYLFDDSRTHLLVDGWAAPRPESVRGNIDWYFFGYGTDYRAALRALGAVAGPAPMPRRYALGSWYSRYWPYTSEEYREIVAEYDRRGYPLDVIVMDMDWHKEGWTGWSWNRELLPDAEELLAWFHERGLAVTLNLHPALGVGPHEDQYGAFMRAIGKDPASGETVPFDAGDRRYAESLFECVHVPLEEHQPPVDRASGPDGGGIPSVVPGHPSPGQRPGPLWADQSAGAVGVDFWWLDWQQEKFTRSIPDLGNLRWLNYLYFEHTRRHGRRGCSFSRWAGWGDHRHPVHFSGDAHTGWDSLAFQVPFTAVAGNVGCFFWSHDIGGHFGPRLEEATARWVQFGALSPVLRLHSARSGALDRRPWMYKPMYEEAMHKAFRLRAELFPYIYSMARKCHTEMLPLCRPMYIDWPEEEEAYENPQEYMLGDELLVAPVTSPGVGPRKVACQGVWFPGDQSEPSRASDRCWYNWFTGERYEAGTEQLVAAEIDEIPLFVRGGAPIVTRGGEPTLRMATAPVDEIVIVCYPGEPGTYFETELYEDDGISEGHARGEYSVTPMRVWWFENEVKVEVGIRVGTFAGMVNERGIVLELRGVRAIQFARVNDSLSTAHVNAHAWHARIVVPSSNSGTSVRFDIGFDREYRYGVEPNEADNDAILRGIHVRDGRARLYNMPRNEGYGFELPERCKVSVVDTIGLHRTVRTKDDVNVPVGHAVAISMPEERIQLPPLGLRGRRSVELEEFEDLGAIVDTRIRHLTSFRILGPFRYDPTKPMHAQRHGPELVPAAERVGKEFIDMNGAARSWVEAPPAEFWPQSIREICGGHNGEAMAYALTHIWSPEEQEVTLLLESGDRLELWLGDERVFSSDEEGKETEATVEEVRATLRKGWNQIMGKTNEGGGGWGFRVAIDGRIELKEAFDTGQ